LRGYHAKLGIPGHPLSASLRNRYQAQDDRDDIRADAVLDIHEAYEKLKTAIETLEVNKLEPVTLSRPVNRPEWESIKIDIFRDILTYTIEDILPIMDGKTEKIPLKVHDRHKDRRELSETIIRERKIDLDFDELQIHSKKEEGKMPFLATEDMTGRSSLVCRHDIGMLIQAKTTCSKIMGRAKDRQATETALLMIINGRPMAEIVEKTGLSVRTLRGYKAEIGVIIDD
jgi:hypothetical protein